MCVCVFIQYLYCYWNYVLSIISSLLLLLLLLLLNCYWIAIELLLNCYWTAIELLLNCYWTAIVTIIIILLYIIIVVVVADDDGFETILSKIWSVRNLQLESPRGSSGSSSRESSFCLEVLGEKPHCSNVQTQMGNKWVADWSMNVGSAQSQ